MPITTPRLTDKRAARPRKRVGIRTLVALVAPVATILGGLFALGGAASAAPATVGLGNATSFAVLAGSTVTNTGPSVIFGDVGVSPGTSITGLPTGQPTGGSIHSADTLAGQAQNDLATAYVDAANRPPNATISADLGGQTLVPGVYKGGALTLTGTLTLNGGTDPNAVFIFQAASTLITASSSKVAFINVNPCNVFWQVGSSATIDTTSTFVGTVMALTDISVNNGAQITGRLLARNGAVTLINDTVNALNCATVLPATTTTSTTTAPTTSAPTTAAPIASPTTVVTPTTTSTAPTTSTTVVSTTMTTAAPTSTTTTAVPVAATATPGGATPAGTGAAGIGSGTPGAGTAGTSSGGVTATGAGTGTGSGAGTGTTATATATRTGTGLAFTGLRAASLGIAGLIAILFGSLLLVAIRRPNGNHFIQ